MRKEPPPPPASVSPSPVPGILQPAAAPRAQHNHGGHVGTLKPVPPPCSSSKALTEARCPGGQAWSRAGPWHSGPWTVPWQVQMAPWGPPSPHHDSLGWGGDRSLGQALRTPCYPDPRVLPPALSFLQLSCAAETLKEGTAWGPRTLLVQTDLHSWTESWPLVASVIFRGGSRLLPKARPPHRVVSPSSKALGTGDPSYGAPRSPHQMPVHLTSDTGAGRGQAWTRAVGRDGPCQPPAHLSQ